jgi:hypothetical protein
MKHLERAHWGVVVWRLMQWGLLWLLHVAFWVAVGMWLLCEHGYCLDLGWSVE